TEANAQPSRRPSPQRAWLFVPAGGPHRRLGLGENAPFEPLGSTDSELIFCELLARAAAQGWRSLGDADLSLLSDWFGALNELGGMTCAISDGRDLAIHVDRRGAQPVFLWELVPPYENV